MACGGSVDRLDDISSDSSMRWESYDALNLAEEFQTGTANFPNSSNKHNFNRSY